MPKSQRARLAKLLHGLEVLPPDGGRAAERLDAAAAHAAHIKSIRGEFREAWADALYEDRRAVLLSFVHGRMRDFAELCGWADGWLRALETSRPAQADGREISAETLEGLRADFDRLGEVAYGALVSGKALTASLESGAAPSDLDAKTADLHEAIAALQGQLKAPALRAILEAGKQGRRQKARAHNSMGRPKVSHAWQAAVTKHLHEARPEASHAEAFALAMGWAKSKKIEGEGEVFRVYWHEPANALQCESHGGQLGLAGFKKRRGALK